MSYVLPTDLWEQVQAHLATGKFANEDEVLRAALEALAWDEAPACEEEDLAAIRESLADLDAGDLGEPVDQVFDAVRRKVHGNGSR